MKRGDIYWCDLSPIVGSEQGGVRPVVILQNDIGNKHSPTTIAAIITSRRTKAKLPTHCWLTHTTKLPTASMVLCEQVRTIDRSRLKGKICRAHLTVNLPVWVAVQVIGLPSTNHFLLKFVIFEDEVKEYGRVF